MDHIEINIDEYRDHPKNPNVHPDEQIDDLAKSLDQFEQVKNIVVWNGFYLAGHGLARAARKRGLKKLMAVDVSHWTEKKALAFMVADNRLPELSYRDDNLLADILKDFDGPDLIPGTDDDFFKSLGLGAVGEDQGPDIYDRGPIKNTEKIAPPPIKHADVGSEPGALARDFLIPPFSILDARQGNWLNRKRQWATFGIKNEAGREHVKILPAKDMRGGELAQASIFDPVLTEIMYRWFCGQGGRILDPFAGGSVRGVVAALLGYDYVGVDVSESQIHVNIKQWAAIGAKEDPAVHPDNYVRSGLTPIEYLEAERVYLKRDDLFCFAGVRGGKVRTAVELMKNSVGAVTAGSRKSPQVLIVGNIANELGIPCRLHTPSGELPDSMKELESAGGDCRFVQHKPGYNSVIIKRAKDDAEKRGWTNIPFGMECDEAILQTSGQVENIPPHIKRIVMPVGSGMSLAGVLHGLVKFKRTDIGVRGIFVGADPVKRLDKFAPPGWRDMVELIKSELDYHVSAPACKIGEVDLDPIYEAKCLPYLEAGDLFWIVGIRGKSSGSGGAVQEKPVGKLEWVLGDSLNLNSLVGGKFDFIFSCPPYGDLEVYSDDARDISYMDYEAFLKTYFTIIDRAVAKLNNNRFACFVVGDFRDGEGFYREFISHTITAFRRSGARLYNDGFIINSYTSLPMRTRRPFERARKLGKAHQNVLVFCKGDPVLATAWINEADAKHGARKNIAGPPGDKKT